MKKAILIFCNLAIIILVLTSNCYAQTLQNNEDEKQSPFVGTWDWEKNDTQWQSFAIWIGERNDSLLFGIGGVFYEGRKIQMPEWDNKRKMIAMIKARTPKGNIVKSKISEAYSNFYFNPEKTNVYNDVSFNLINDSTMFFILNDNKGYWPDSAIMKRRDRINNKFSYAEEEYIYKK